MKLFTLTDEEVDDATRFAVKLVAAGKRGTIESHLIGTLGEMGYGKHIKSKVNLEVYERGIGDKGADFKDVQVKTATWTGDNKELKINKEDSCLENPNVNTFVLMHTTLKDRNKVYLVGKICKSNFLKKAYLNTKYNTLTVNEYDLDERF